MIEFPMVVVSRNLDMLIKGLSAFRTPCLNRTVHGDSPFPLAVTMNGWERTSR